MTLPPASLALGGCVSEIVSAYVGNHSVEATALPGLVQSVRRALASLSETPPEGKLEPAVPIKKSVFPSYIVCLEDGKKLSMLKRHLKAVYNLGPDEYRARWDLPPSYPMVAPDYSERRARLAKEQGLGRKRQFAAELAAEEEHVVQRIPGGRRHGKRKRLVQRLSKGGSGTARGDQL
jgi:predicted transcriptional regulator